MKKTLKCFKKQSGFTLVELLIIMSIVFTLFGFITVNLLQEQHITSVNSSVDILVSDMASQQTKALVGKRDSFANENSFGIYFQADRYTLFSGTTYSATDSGNFTVILEKNISFGSITFPNNTIVFLVHSGEVSGFINGSNTIVVKNATGPEQKTITVNRYGVVKSVN